MKWLWLVDAENRKEEDLCGVRAPAIDILNAQLHLLTTPVSDISTRLDVKVVESLETEKRAWEVLRRKIAFSPDQVVSFPMYESSEIGTFS